MAVKMCVGSGSFFFLEQLLNFKALYFPKYVYSLPTKAQKRKGLMELSAYIVVSQFLFGGRFFIFIFYYSKCFL